MKKIYEMNQSEIESVLWTGADKIKAVKLRDKFNDDDLIKLIENPKFKSFDESFKEMIWQTVSSIFGEELNKVSFNN